MKAIGSAVEIDNRKIPVALARAAQASVARLTLLIPLRLKCDSHWLRTTDPSGVSMTRKRKHRHFTVDDKAAILRRHLVDEVPGADLCDEYKPQSSVFYQNGSSSSSITPPEPWSPAPNHSSRLKKSLGSSERPQSSP